MGRASNEQLEALWQALLEYLLDKMQNPPPEGLRASFLAVVVKFLAQSGVIRPSETEDGMDHSKLIAKLQELRADTPN